jgi:PTH1 family peptidyl-tRNA hydrolase
VIRWTGDEVSRLRIGIGEPGDGQAVDHVLSRFRQEERRIANDAIDRAADAVEVWASEGLDTAMNRFN